MLVHNAHEVSPLEMAAGIDPEKLSLLELNASGQYLRATDRHRPRRRRGTRIKPVKNTIWTVAVRNGILDQRDREPPLERH